MVIRLVSLFELQVGDVIVKNRPKLTFSAIMLCLWSLAWPYRKLLFRFDLCQV